VKSRVSRVGHSIGKAYSLLVALILLDEHSHDSRAADPSLRQ